MIRRLPRSAWIKLVVLLAIIGTAVVAQLMVGLPSQEELGSALDDLGAWAVPAFIAVYLLVAMLPAGPAVVVTIVGGALLGFPVALPAVLFAATLGATIAFGISRFLGRDAVTQVSSERVRALDARVREHGLATVLVARLVPLIPFTTANYAFGLTSVRLSSFLVGTAVGILPGTAVYVSVGAFGTEPGSLPFLLSIAALVLLTAIGWWRSRRAGGAPA